MSLTKDLSLQSNITCLFCDNGFFVKKSNIIECSNCHKLLKCDYCGNQNNLSLMDQKDSEFNCYCNTCGRNRKWKEKPKVNNGKLCSKCKNHSAISAGDTLICLRCGFREPFYMKEKCLSCGSNETIIGVHGVSCSKCGSTWKKGNLFPCIITEKNVTFIGENVASKEDNLVVKFKTLEEDGINRTTSLAIMPLVAEELEELNRKNDSKSKKKKNKNKKDEDPTVYPVCPDCEKPSHSKLTSHFAYCSKCRKKYEFNLINELDKIDLSLIESVIALPKSKKSILGKLLQFKISDLEQFIRYKNISSDLEDTIDDIWERTTDLEEALARNDFVEQEFLAVQSSIEDLKQIQTQINDDNFNVGSSDYEIEPADHLWEESEHKWRDFDQKQRWGVRESYTEVKITEDSTGLDNEVSYSLDEMDEIEPRKETFNKGKPANKSLSALEQEFIEDTIEYIRKQPDGSWVNISDIRENVLLAGQRVPSNFIEPILDSSNEIDYRFNDDISSSGGVEYKLIGKKEKIASSEVESLVVEYFNNETEENEFIHLSWIEIYLDRKGLKINADQIDSILSKSDCFIRKRNSQVDGNNNIGYILRSFDPKDGIKLSMCSTKQFIDDVELYVARCHDTEWVSIRDIQKNVLSNGLKVDIYEVDDAISDSEKIESRSPLPSVYDREYRLKHEEKLDSTDDVPKEHMEKYIKDVEEYLSSISGNATSSIIRSKVLLNGKYIRSDDAVESALGNSSNIECELAKGVRYYRLRPMIPDYSILQFSRECMLGCEPVRCSISTIYKYIKSVASKKFALISKNKLQELLKRQHWVDYDDSLDELVFTLSPMEPSQ